MGRPRLYATSVERKAAWRRRHGMAVRPHYPSAAAKQAAYRARKRQAARDLAARECAVIQQALQTRARADQCWELHTRIDDWSRDAGMPQRASDGRLRSVAGASASFYEGRGRPAQAAAGAAAPGVSEGHQGRPHGCAESRQNKGVYGRPPSQGPCGAPVMGPWLARPPCVRCPLAQN